jgi:hypothetical protein
VQRNKVLEGEAKVQVSTNESQLTNSPSSLAKALAVGRRMLMKTDGARGKVAHPCGEKVCQLPLDGVIQAGFVDVPGNSPMIYHGPAPSFPF